MENTLKEFTAMLCGSFDNHEQYDEMTAKGEKSFPFARHVNTVCNDRIKGLPEGFEGIFVLEESYYTIGDNTNAMPHLFHFTMEGDSVKLSSYELPEGIDKKTLNYESLPTLDYSMLKVSEKFTPALYKECDGAWEGGSESMFSPVVRFKLWERFSKECLEVSEIIEVNGKRTFGYDVPLLYKRTNILGQEDKDMETHIKRDEALELLKKYNKEPFHIQHGITVGKVMAWYAGELGYGAEADFWEITGILHDIDFELYPEEHCKKAPELLKDIDAEPEVVHAVCSHGYGMCSDVEPVHEMEKVLFAADELTGLIWAAAKMRPSKSTKDMEFSSLKKKFKDKRFAAGCSRDTIKEGAERLGWSLDELLERTLKAMQASEDEINSEMERQA